MRPLSRVGNVFFAEALHGVREPTALQTSGVSVTAFSYSHENSRFLGRQDGNGPH
jgi:hypothetical protein